MQNTIAHVAVAVNDLQSARDFFELIGGVESSEPHIVPSQKVKTSFIPIGETNIELLEPTHDDSPVSRFLDRGGGIHHICIETSIFDDLIKQVTSKGIRTLGDPFIGAKSRRVVFFHPKDTYGVLIELEER